MIPLKGAKFLDGKALQCVFYACTVILHFRPRLCRNPSILRIDLTAMHIALSNKQFT